MHGCKISIFFKALNLSTESIWRQWKFSHYLFTENLLQQCPFFRQTLSRTKFESIVSVIILFLIQVLQILTFNNLWSVYHPVFSLQINSVIYFKNSVLKKTKKKRKKWLKIPKPLLIFASTCNILHFLPNFI